MHEAPNKPINPDSQKLRAFVASLSAAGYERRWRSEKGGKPGQKFSHYTNTKTVLSLLTELNQTERIDDMRKAGGIIGLIAGIFGVLAAGATLFMGGLAGAFEAEGAETVVGLGWGGVLFSFLTIVLGAVCIGAKGRIPGILLIVSAILGAVLGGTLVAIFMVLALIGGILALFGPKQKTAEATAA